MSDDITILIDDQPVAPTTLWRALLPLVWLFAGFAALGFLSAFAGLIPLWIWGIPVLVACACWLSRYAIDWEYDEKGYSEKFDRWRGE